MSDAVALSAVVPVTERFDDVIPLFEAYKGAMEATGLAYEFVYVLDGEYPRVLSDLRTLRERGERIRIVSLAKWFGEATALSIGFAHAAGEIILTLPAYAQIRPDQVAKLIEAVDGNDMVVARRRRSHDSRLNVIQSRAFHGLLNLMIDTPFHDLGCSVRAFRRALVEELHIYGDQHRFLPLLAHRRGFRVAEVELDQAETDAFRRLYPLGLYLRRILDILTIVFILKFTKKPLRFFGLIGSFLLVLGALGTLYLAIERLFGGVALADRPALVLAVLMIVLGFQMIAVGLIGELIIFTHARDIKEYTIDEIIG